MNYLGLLSQSKAVIQPRLFVVFPRSSISLLPTECFRLFRNRLKQYSRKQHVSSKSQIQAKYCFFSLQYMEESNFSLSFSKRHSNIHQTLRMGNGLLKVLQFYYCVCMTQQRREVVVMGGGTCVEARGKLSAVSPILSSMNSGSQAYIQQGQFTH